MTAHPIPAVPLETHQVMRDQTKPQQRKLPGPLGDT